MIIIKKKHKVIVCVGLSVVLNHGEGKESGQVAPPSVAPHLGKSQV